MDLCLNDGFGLSDERFMGISVQGTGLVKVIKFSDRVLGLLDLTVSDEVRVFLYLLWLKHTSIVATVAIVDTFG